MNTETGAAWRPSKREPRVQFLERTGPQNGPSFCSGGGERLNSLGNVDSPKNRYHNRLQTERGNTNLDRIDIHLRHSQLISSYHEIRSTSCSSGTGDCPNYKAYYGGPFAELSHRDAISRMETAARKSPLLAEPLNPRCRNLSLVASTVRLICVHRLLARPMESFLNQSRRWRISFLRALCFDPHSQVELPKKALRGCYLFFPM